jgi:hypothetical protein
MEKYFYKLVDNIDFVWKINTHVLDPYKKGEIDFGHYVNNQRVFNPYLFESLRDFQQKAIRKREAFCLIHHLLKLYGSNLVNCLNQ